jgi:hypothetical protein
VGVSHGLAEELINRVSDVQGLELLEELGLQELFTQVPLRAAPRTAFRLRAPVVDVPFLLLRSDGSAALAADEQAPVGKLLFERVRLASG